MRSHAIMLCIPIVMLLGAIGCQKGTGVTTVEPNTGNVAGNDSVVIHGSGLKPGMTVHFGKRQCPNVVIESDSKIRVKTPSGGEGPVDVIVTDEQGKTFVLKEGFRYHSQIGK